MADPAGYIMFSYVVVSRAARASIPRLSNELAPCSVTSMQPPFSAHLRLNRAATGASGTRPSLHA